jgi:tetratricopeptide (TPR) repeat protein
MNKTLICTGFHRSATSATANYLFDAGLDFGADLMVGHIGNTKGHFEDWDVVNLHDAFLASLGTNWQFHEQYELQGNTEKIQQYVQQRNGKSSHWCVKDPRACLFLNDWEHVLGENGYYLFVVRHWSSCIESLLHRHSREIAHKMPELSVDNTDYQFWLKPELAANMWLTYNKRILEFIRKNRGKVLLVTQRALFEGAPILEFLNDRFAFKLNTNINSPLDVELLRDQASESVRGSLSNSLCAQLDKVHAELLALSDFKSNDENPIYIKNTCVAGEVLGRLYQSINQLNAGSSPAIVSGNSISNIDWLAKFSLLTSTEQAINQLNSTSKKLLPDIEIARLQCVIDEKYMLNGAVLLAFAKLLMRIDYYESSIRYFQKTVSLGMYLPYIDMLIAQCYQQLSLNEEAHFFFDKAIKANPNNPIFYTNKAIFLVTVNKNEQAATLFEQGYQIGSKQPACVLPYCEYLLKNIQKSKAEELLVALIDETDNSAAHNMLIRLKLSAGWEGGKDYYLASVKARLLNKDKTHWLAQACSYIPSRASETDFISRLYEHWGDVEKS